MTKGEKASVYQVVTDRLIEAVTKTGVLPWRKPWSPGGGQRNGLSGKVYRGGNQWWLSAIAGAFGYEHGAWLTYNQAAELGGQVRKGEKSAPVTFWKRTEREDSETGTVKRGLILRYYNVFNIAQIDGLNMDRVKLGTTVRPTDPIAEAERIIAEYVRPGNLSGPVFTSQDSDRAFYMPIFDSITVPLLGQFKNAEEYYSTVFHEMGHSTGHKSRLGRFAEDGRTVFGDKTYAAEELVAEMTAALLCQMAGMDVAGTEQNSAAYLKGWLSALADDPKLLVSAAGKAQKAADCILGVTFDAEQPAPAEQPELAIAA